MIVLGISGRKRAGKDTLAKAIIREGEQRGLKVVRRAFADDLKASAAAALGLDGTTEQCVSWMDALKEDGEIVVAFGGSRNLNSRTTYRITGREYLQWYGTEAHRDVFGQEFWVKNMLNKMLDEDIEADVVVVTDVRFENEARAVKEFGDVVEVVRPSLDEGEDTHSSEAPLPRELVDTVVKNNSGVEALDLVARALLDRYKEDL